jgi:hypothetical protein
MLETRHALWQYDYMSFSRRIGELWEPFCKLCFEHAPTPIQFYVAPIFLDIKQKLQAEMMDYVQQLPLTEVHKTELLAYYNRIWGLVSATEIQLQSDLHVIFQNKRFVIDFKSGFGSNEKGNMNRLLLIATAYQLLDENFRCVLLVRADEDNNNHYFQTLKTSTLWDAYCGKDTYQFIQTITDFNLKEWVDSNINWQSDLNPDMWSYLVSQNLLGYLQW